MGSEKGIPQKEKMERAGHVVEGEARGWVPVVTGHLARMVAGRGGAGPCRSARAGVLILPKSNRNVLIVGNKGGMIRFAF